MFFTASKLAWLLLAPSNLALLALVAGVLALRTRWRRAGRRLCVAAAVVFVAAGSGLPGAWALRVLEGRFPAPVLAEAPAGILVLGGAVDENLGAARGQTALSDAAERMTEAVALARRYPAARLLFSGGTAALLDPGPTEAEAARALWLSLGVAPQRIELEAASRNTHENAVLSREIARPRPGEAWLLVTSAFHMPRAVGIFRQAGFPVVPYPVDYRTFGTARDWRPQRQVAEGLLLADLAAREWLGLLAYRLSGRTDALFPAP